MHSKLSRRSVLAGASLALVTPNSALAGRASSPLTQTRLSQSELDERLEAHNAWLNGDERGSQLILQGIRAPELDFAGQNLTEAVIQNCDLTGSNLSGTKSDRTSFHDSCLKAANISNSFHPQSDFDGVDFSDAVLTNTNFTHSTLRFARFTAFPSIVSHSVLHGADFTNAICQPVSEGEHCGVVFIDNDCTRANFSDVEFNRPYLGLSSFHHTQFIRTRFILDDEVSKDGLAAIAVYLIQELQGPNRMQATVRELSIQCDPAAWHNVHRLEDDDAWNWRINFASDAEASAEADSLTHDDRARFVGDKMHLHRH